MNRDIGGDNDDSGAPALRNTLEQVAHARLIVTGMSTGDDRPAMVADARDLLEMIGLIEPGADPRGMCGTWQGFNRHQQMREEPCEACREAHGERRRVHRRASE